MSQLLGLLFLLQPIHLHRLSYKTTYEGEWVATKKEGQGVETWPNGYIYKGEFKNSQWSGKGVLTFPDGSTYDGEWSKGFMNGHVHS